MYLAQIDWNRLLRPELIWVVIPVVAIVFHSVRSIIVQSNIHQERMEMIKRGMHPDDPQARAQAPEDAPRGGQAGAQNLG